MPGPEIKNKEQMIKPVEDAMTALIEGAVINKAKRIVVTSSMASVVGGIYKKDVKDPWYSEKDYPPLEGCDPYALGKIA
jgi:nucleoside-diphosphate-sugar epimerase